jgi:hypothetical protein
MALIVSKATTENRPCYLGLSALGIPLVETMLFRVLWLSVSCIAISAASNGELPAWSVPSIVVSPAPNSTPAPPAFRADPVPLPVQPKSAHQQISARYHLGQRELKPIPFHIGRKLAHLTECLKLAESKESEDELLLDNNDDVETKWKRVTFKAGAPEIRHFSINDNHGVPLCPGPVAELKEEVHDAPLLNRPILKRRASEPPAERQLKRARIEPEATYVDDSYVMKEDWLLLSSGPFVHENRVVIYPLHEGTTSDEVFQYYQKFGPPGTITRIAVVEDEAKKRPTVAFIDFDNKDAASLAILDGMKHRCPGHRILSDCLVIDFCPCSFTFTHRILAVANVSPETLPKFAIISTLRFWILKKTTEVVDPETGWKWTTKVEFSQVARILRSKDQPNQIQLVFYSRKHLEMASQKLNGIGFLTRMSQ